MALGIHSFWTVGRKEKDENQEVWKILPSDGCSKPASAIDLRISGLRMKSLNPLECKAT
jgi:hypothetical protein